MDGIKTPENSSKKKITGENQVIKTINKIKFYFEICDFFFAEFSQVLLFSIFFVVVGKIALRLSSVLTQGKDMTEICLSVIK